MPPPRARTKGSRDSAAWPRIGFELLVFDAAKAGLAHLLENGGNGKAGALFDARVEVFKAPAELASEHAADGGFAATHESAQAHHAGTGWMAAEGVRCEKACCKTGASDYSRLEILIVPLNEESSTLACPGPG